ncbi:hypothetical protein EJD97_000346, partial [Solanum chilense]
MVEIQSWLHLFNRKSPILHKEEVCKFYYNVQFKEDGSILTRVNDITVQLDEGVLRKILRVPREGTRSVLGSTCSIEFVSVISKTPTTKVAGIYKKIMKSEYQLVFEFINKVLLPRTEKRIVATAADLFVMEMLCSFKALNLPGLVLEHIQKTVIERKCVHGMGYGYFLMEVFKHFQISHSVGKVGTVKQTISDSTLVECECIEGRGYPKSKTAQLIEDQDQLKHEVEEITVRLSGKEAEIAILKEELLTA